MTFIAHGQVRALLECGADRNALLLGDTTALYLAAQNGFAEVGEP